MSKSSMFSIPPAVVFFIVSPLLALFLALKNLVRKSNGIVLILFYAVYGYSHSFLDTRGDSYRKYLHFLNTDPNGSYSEIFEKYTQGKLLDIFEPLLLLFVRSFTNNPHIFLALVGGIGGTFVYLTLYKVWRFCGGKCTLELYIASLLIILLFNPVLIGGVRFFIAFSVFTYTVTTILLEKKHWAWVLLMLCPLIHFSFWALVIFAFISQFLHLNNSILWRGLVFICLISIILEVQDWKTIFSLYNLSDANEAIGGRAMSYSSEKTVAKFASSLTTQLLQVQQHLTRLSVLLTLSIVRRRLPILSLSSWDTELYRLTLLFLSFGYLFISLSVVGERYLFPGLFLLVLLLCRLSTYPKGKIFNKMLIVMLVLSLVSIGWIIVNTYFLIDHRLFYAPFPFIFT